MQRIWKFPLDVTDEQLVQMPMSAQVLAVQVQRETPCIWALVEDYHPEVLRRVRIVGTGHPFADADDWTYVGTFQLHGGGLVFHAFMDEEASA